MAASGLLVSYPNNKMRFAHPVFAGYLAGYALTNYNTEEVLVNQPDWSGKYLAMRYFAARGDASKLVQNLLETSSMPMHRPLLRRRAGCVMSPRMRRGVENYLVRWPLFCKQTASRSTCADKPWPHSSSAMTRVPPRYFASLVNTFV